MVSSHFVSKVCTLSPLSSIVQKVGDVQNCTVCIADLDMFVDHPCDSSPSQQPRQLLCFSSSLKTRFRNSPCRFFYLTTALRLNLMLPSRSYPEPNFIYPGASLSKSVRTSRKFTAENSCSTVGKRCRVAKLQISNCSAPFCRDLSFSKLTSSVVHVVMRRSCR